MAGAQGYESGLRRRFGQGRDGRKANVSALRSRLGQRARSTAEETPTAQVRAFGERPTGVGVRFFLLLLVLMALAPLTVLSVARFLLERDQALQDQSADLLAVTGALTRGYHELVYRDTASLLGFLAGLEGVRRPDPSGCRELMARARSQRPVYLTLGVAEASGHVRCAADDRSPAALPMDFVRGVLQGQGMVLSDLRETPWDGEPTLLAGVPLDLEEPEGRGVIFAVIDLKALNAGFAEDPPPPDTRLVVLDRQGRAVLEVPPASVGVGRFYASTEVFQAAQSADAAPARTVEAVDLEGERRLFAFEPLLTDRGEPYGYLLLGMRLGAVYGEAERRFLGSLAALLAVAFAGALSAWYVADRVIVADFDRVVQAVRCLQRGDFSVRAADDSPVLREIGMVAQAVDEMAQQLERADHDRRRYDETLARRVEELTVLHAVARACAEARSEADLIEQVTDIIGEAFYPDHFGFLLLEEGVGLRPHPSYRGLSDQAWRDVIPLGPEGVTVQAALTGLPMLVPDTSREPRYIPVDPPMGSELCVPLKAGGRVLGVINAECAATGAFDAADERLLLTVADQVATAMERLRAQTSERQRARELEVMAEVSSALRSAEVSDEMPPIVLTYVSTLFEAQAAALVLRGPNGGRWRVEAAQGAWQALAGRDLEPEAEAARRLEQGEPCLRHGEGCPPFEGVASVALAPLRAHGEVIGGLLLGSDSPLEEAALGILGAVADIAASALQRARFHEETHRRADQLVAINVLGVRLAETRDMTRLYRLLSDTVHRMLPGIHTLALTLREDGGDRLRPVHLVREGLEQEARALPPLAEPEARQEVLRTQRARLLNGASGSALLVPLMVRGQAIGLLEVQSPEPEAFSALDVELLTVAANTAAVAFENAHLLRDLQRANLELTRAYDATLEGWVRVLDLRDRETEGHSLRVAEMTVRLARLLGVAEDELVHIRRGALLHDIGKMAIPDAILRKPGPLTEEEWAVMRQHPVVAYNLLAPIPYLRPALDIPYCHHEKWDGSGYPRGLKGEAIPLPARIFAVIDVWDALTCDRPYRKAWPEAEALAYLRDQAGKHFDPDIVPVFLEHLDELRHGL